MSKFQKRTEFGASATVHEIGGTRVKIGVGSQNGASGTSDIEGKAARVAASECGQ